MNLKSILKFDVPTALTELTNALRNAVDTSIVSTDAVNSMFSKTPKGLKVINVNPSLFDLETLDALVSVAYPGRDLNVIYFEAEEPDKYSKGSPSSLFIGSAAYKDDEHSTSVVSSL